MAAHAQTSARLTAGAAVAVTVIDAVVAPAGPWEPASVILGWAAVVAVAVGVTAGVAGGVVTAAVLQVVRLGVAGAAGASLLHVVGSIALVVAAIELASRSFEARLLPTELGVALVAPVVAAAAAGAGAALVVGFLAPGGPASPGWRVAGVAAACGVVVVTLGVQRRRPPAGQSTSVAAMVRNLSRLWKASM